MYRQVVPLSGTVETNYEINATLVDLFYNNEFSISIEEQADSEAGEQGWVPIRATVGDDVNILLELSGDDATRVATLTRTVTMGSNTLELVITTGLQSAIADALTEGKTLRMIITPAIAPEIDGQNEFPANNISVESLNSAFRKRDLQDIYAREFSLRGPRGEPGRRGWVPQLGVETMPVPNSADIQIFIKLEAWVGGEGETPTEFVGQYLATTGGFTTDRSMATNFRGVPGPQGTKGDQGDRGITGYSPIFEIVEDGERAVIRLDNWVLPPGQTAQGRFPAGAGQYLGPMGLVSDRADAVNIKGADGTNGTNGMVGPRGAQGRYAVRVYVALTEAERTVSGVVRTPNRPTATGYDPDTNTLTGLTANPAWSLTFPAGDDIVADNKDVFESFATYDPHTDRLTAFTTPFEITNERGPSGPAGRDGLNGYSPDLDVITQTDNAMLPSSMGTLTDENGVNLHADFFYQNDDNLWIMPTSFATSLLYTGSISSNIFYTPRFEGTFVSLFNLDSSLSAYNNTRYSRLTLSRVIGSNAPQYLSFYMNIEDEDVRFYANAHDIANSGTSTAGVTDVRMRLIIDGVASPDVAPVIDNDSQSSLVFSSIYNRQTVAAQWTFEDAGNILRDGLFHTVRVEFLGQPSDHVYTLTYNRAAHSSGVIENKGQVLHISRFIGGTGAAPDTGTGLFLKEGGTTPFIEDASSIFGPEGDKGDKGDKGEDGDDGQFHYSIYTNAATAPANPGTVPLVLADLDTIDSHTIGTTIWTNTPSARTAGQVTYVAQAIIDPNTAQSGRVNAVFSSPNRLTGDRGPQGLQGIQGAGGLQIGRNFIINGGMVIDQRESGQSAAFQAVTDGTIARKWVKDRWSLASPYPDYAVSISTEKTNATRSRRALKFTATGGTGLVSGRQAWTWDTANGHALPTSGAVTLTTTLSQEAAFKAGWGIADAADMQLSFMFKSPTANTNYTIQLIDHAAGTNSNKLVSFRATAADTWERHTISIGGRTTGDAVDVDNINNKGLEIQFRLFESTVYSEATGTAADGSWTGSAADTATLNGGEGFRERALVDGGRDALNDAWEISDVQLEKNAAATEFELEDYDLTLEKCSRYFTREHCVFQRVYSPDFEALIETRKNAPTGARPRSWVNFTIDDSGRRVILDFAGPVGMRIEKPIVGSQGVAFGTAAHNNTNRSTNNPFTFHTDLIPGRIDALSLKSSGIVVLECESDDRVVGSVGWGNAGGDERGPLLDFDAEFSA